MKKLILITAGLLVGSVSYGNDSLTETMQSLGNEFKSIAIAIGAKKVTEAELDASEKMQRLIANAGLIYPDSASSEALKAQYSMIMTELIKKALELEDAIEIQLSNGNQDLTEVTAIFKLMNEIRQKGHDQFKTE